MDSAGRRNCLLLTGAAVTVTLALALMLGCGESRRLNRLFREPAILRYDNETTQPVTRAWLGQMADRAVTDAGFPPGALRVVPHEGDEGDEAAGRYIVYLSTMDNIGAVRVQLDVDSGVTVTLAGVK